jgi:hypothetical protein
LLLPELLKALVVVVMQVPEPAKCHLVPEARCLALKAWAQIGV